MVAEWLADVRNRLFASRRFQDFAATAPGFRGIARRRAGRLFDLCAGFVYAQVLAACTELSLFEKVQSRPVPLGRLAEDVHLSRPAMERLVKAASALDLLALRSGERVALGPQGAALMGNPSVFTMIHHHRLLYQDLADPVALLRQQKGQSALARFWGYGEDGGKDGGNPGDAEAYSALMEATQAFIAAEVLSVHNFASCRALLDIGGGSGAFTTAVARAAPNLTLTVFDLPPVAKLARARFEREGLSDRATAVGGSFRTDPLPTGADLITLVRVLHDHDDETVSALLSLAYDALPDDGALLIVEPMAGTRGADAMGDAYFGMYLWALGTGAPRTEAVLKEYLAEAGFQRVRSLRNRRPLLTRVLLAKK